MQKIFNYIDTSLTKHFNDLVEPPGVFEELCPEHLPLDGVDEGGELIKAQVMLIISPEEMDL